MMGERQIVIIGAGVGGLATGCYGQMNGYRTRIFEMHSLPGGLCTSWRRKGYIFDGCIHHLAGCRPDHKLYRVWKELGAMPRRILHSRELVQAEDAAGNRLTVYTDLDRLAHHMQEMAPDDAKTIDQLVRGAKRLRRFDPLDLAVASPREILASLPVLLPGLRWMKETMADAALRFHHPFLRRAFPTLQYDAPANPVATFLNLLAQSEIGNVGWPEGGSLAFAQDIARRYLDLGGHIYYKARVERILVEEDRAVGVRLADGSEHRANVVISNGYGRATVLDLLQGRYVDERLKALYASPVDEIGMGIQLSLGVNRDLSQEPRALVLLLDRPVVAGGRSYDRLYLELFGLDPSLAPPGKGVLKVELATSYSHWRDLGRDRQRYDAEKQELATRIIDQLEPRFPRLKAQIEAVDVATPMTTERYTANAQAFQNGLDIPVLDMLTGKNHVRTLPGLGDFYMVGQSAGFPGLPGVAGMGRGLMQALCKQDGKPFGTQTS